ncbi:hypothetical protein V1512DRAFT_244745 [Lipomyces arxii]|uniref:uncharacterized protein n=1 Tax=Lipomyces arxii TaxID=56418 RepID=UPI0034CF961D
MRRELTRRLIHQLSWLELCALPAFDQPLVRPRRGQLRTRAGVSCALHRMVTTRLYTVRENSRPSVPVPQKQSWSKHRRKHAFKFTNSDVAELLDLRTSSDEFMRELFLGDGVQDAKASDDDFGTAMQREPKPLFESNIPRSVYFKAAPTTHTTKLEQSVIGVRKENEQFSENKSQTIDVKLRLASEFHMEDGLAAAILPVIPDGPMRFRLSFLSKNNMLTLGICLELLRQVRIDASTAKKVHQFAKQNLVPLLKFKRYDLLVEDFNRAQAGTELLLLQKLCAIIQGQELARVSTLDALSKLTFKIAPENMAQLLLSIRNCEELKRACRLLSPPDFQYDHSPDRWLLRQVGIIARQTVAGARRLLIMILLHLALEFRHDFLCGSMVINFFRAAPEEERPRLIPPMLINMIIDHILSTLEMKRDPMLAEHVVQLWKHLLQVGGQLTTGQQFKLMEISIKLNYRPPTISSGPDAVLQMIREQTVVRQVPLSFYWKVIEQHLKAKNVPGALRNANLMLEQEEQMSAHPPALMADLLHELTRNRMYMDANKLVARMDKKTILAPVMLEQLVNFCARTENSGLGEQLIALIPRPFSRQMLRQLLFYSLRMKDDHGRDAVIAMLQKPVYNNLSVEELGMLADQVYDRDGLELTSEFVQNLPEEFQPSVWRSVLGKALLDKADSFAIKAASKSKRDSDGYYLNMMLTFVARTTGVSSAIKVVRKLIEHPVRKHGALPAFATSEMRIAARALSENISDRPTFTNHFRFSKTSAILPELFLEPGPHSAIASTREHMLNDKQRTNKFQVITRNEPDMSLFDGCPRPNIVTLVILGRLALAEKNEHAFNWLLLTLESFGMHPDDIKHTFESDVSRYKRGLPMTKHGEQERLSHTILEM